MNPKIIDSNIQPNKSFTKIFHIADIHIPNETNRHEEFRLVFSNLYQIIKSKKTQDSLIVICGDIINKSNKISPECINLVKNFFYQLSNICYTIIISGNHDDNIRGNDLKIDSITSIINDLNNPNLFYFRDTGLYINSSTDGQLDLVADTEIQIAATTIDINGNVLLSADLSVGDDLTIEGGLIDLRSNSG